MRLADLRAGDATPKPELLARCAAALADRWSVADDADVRAFLVPGRIEVLGKHTDYAGGRSLVAAVRQGVCLLAAPRDDGRLRVAAADLDDAREFALDADLAPEAGTWANYPMTVARRVARNFGPPLAGADVAFAADLPPAAGMSSSSAVMVAHFLALSALNGLADREAYRREVRTDEDLAGYLGTVENGQSFGSLAGDRGVGTFGGSEDHVAMLCGRDGQLSQYAYCPVRLQRRIDLPDGCVFAVAASGVEAVKTGEAMAKYNRASALARAAVGAWNAATGRDDPHLSAALTCEASTGEAAERIRHALVRSGPRDGFTGEEMARRFEHFHTESERIIPAAGDALGAGDLLRFGRECDASQSAAERLLGNQVPETVYLASEARALGAWAASAFGAGFGGSVWALVAGTGAEAFLDEWRARYADAFPRPASRARFLLTMPGPPAGEIA